MVVVVVVVVVILGFDTVVLICFRLMTEVLMVLQMPMQFTLSH